MVNTVHSKKFYLICISIVNIAFIEAMHSRYLTLRHLPYHTKHLAGLQKILGKRFNDYNPKMRIIADQRNIVKKRPCLFLHGFYNDSSQVFNFYRNNCLVGDTITFDFPDVIGRKKTDLQRTSFSQENDVFAAISALRHAQEERIITDSVDIFAYSRGAGTAGNMIHVLANPSKAHQKKLAALEIDNAKRLQLLETIKNGSVILDRPLVNLRACLQALGKHHANQFLEAPRQTLYKTSLCQLLQYLENNSVATAVSKGLLFSLALFVHYTSMGFVTRFNYSPFGLNLWDSSTSLREHGIKTLLHFQHHDVVVSNEYDISLYEKLARGNPEHTYVIFGNNGGHNCKPYDLIPYAHTFRQLYGGSYNPNLALRPTALAALCKPTVVQHEPFIERLKKLTGKKL